MRVWRALVGLAFGDAYGLQYECIWPKPKLSWIDPRDLGFGCVDECGGRCCYSDDTEMTLALALCMLEDYCNRIDELSKCIARHIDVSKRVRYYSIAMKEVTSMIASGAPWLDSTHSILDVCRFDPSPGVRAIAAALLAKDLEKALKLSALQAIATHVCREAVERAMVVGAITYLVVREGISHRAAIEELRWIHRWSPWLTKILDLVPSIAEDPPSEVVKKLVKLGATAVEMGLVAAYLARDPLEALARAISLGGDVDTAAAIACSMVSASSREPPKDLVAKIEGIERIKALSLKLALRTR